MKQRTVTVLLPDEKAAVERWTKRGWMVGRRVVDKSQPLSLRTVTLHLTRVQATPKGK